MKAKNDYVNLQVFYQEVIQCAFVFICPKYGNFDKIHTESKFHW